MTGFLARLGDLRAMLADRIGAAWLVVMHYHAVQARGGHGPIELCDGGAALARIDRITVRGGRTRIDGVQIAPEIRFATERDHALVRRDDAQGGRFSVDIEGALRLRWATGRSARMHAIPLAGPFGRVRNASRTSRRLAAFAWGARADLARYALRGDPAAGQRLEHALLPRPAPSPLRRVEASLFEPAPLPPRAPVDIVLPVHDALSDLRHCLAALAPTLGPGDRVIAIDDASTDPEVLVVLRDWVARVPGAVLLENATNLGFVGSVNRALGMRRGDVVLLNSDAVVPEGWLDRIMAPFADGPDIASVTPLSNDAEIGSVPVICRPRRLAPGEAAAIDATLANLDWRQTLSPAPTGVGFCMALSGRWLDRAGAFDPAFGPGYGEEVDWCRRTAAMGAAHILHGGLFVEHRSGRSFGEARPALIAEGNRMIARRYPGYDRMVMRFIEDDPGAVPRLIAGVALAGQGNGPLDLFLAHDWGGGANDWLMDEVRGAVDARGAALVLRAQPRENVLAAELYSAEGRVAALVPLGALKALLAPVARRCVVYSSLVGAHDPLAAMRALLGAIHPGDRVEAVFHDYFPLCPSYNLLGHDGRFCDLPAPASCEACYRRLSAPEWVVPSNNAAWRDGWHAFMSRADAITVFAPSGKRLVTRVWPELAPRIAIQPHRLLATPERLSPPGGGGTVVGVLGNIGYPKGAAVIRDLAAHSGPDFRIVVIGKLAPGYSDPRLIVHGPYLRSEIAALGRRYGVTCWLIPSIWPETFSFALHEALATGLEVFGYDMGGQGDALRAAPNGHVVAPGTRLDPSTFDVTPALSR
ncbi:glycosyltransferase [Palleronia sediminis]|uniref:Glycosyltransferase n=1 Tax=Palleronia sediminis TaxID=2547833 RepID=A0A4R6ANK5_9RHOB|nr:glycosyltransferase [Palleronia sediminis]TDL83516.1 glycosyltransferase [Palleronia sediminis]